MRIRKHFLSLSTSITAPIQPSPLDLSSGDRQKHEQQSLLVVQRQEEVHPNDNKLSTLSDPSSKTKELESEKKKETIKIDVTGKKEISILCPETETSSSHDNGLFEGDNYKLIPTKKRSEISIGKRVKHDDFDQEYKEGIMTKSNTKKIKKNEKRGNVIKEGSRCSRVNGRGWRCGQQTIVGYSLCEHHLGKGRLRTMSSRVRGQSQKNAPKEQETIMGMIKSKEIETILIDDNELDEDDVEEVELISSSHLISNKKKTGWCGEGKIVKQFVEPNR
uniref:uncharacterized protein LOC122608196 n=1 Tax=Erigeron canadensis TaxID=72917 RepID=UPI001CB8BAA1|nr:uncharacterized protein LOC122608196 [Erigeron canadensis]